MPRPSDSSSVHRARTRRLECGSRLRGRCRRREQITGAASPPAPRSLTKSKSISPAGPESSTPRSYRCARRMARSGASSASRTTSPIAGARRSSCGGITKNWKNWWPNARPSWRRASAFPRCRNSFRITSGQPGQTARSITSTRGPSSTSIARWKASSATAGRK